MLAIIKREIEERDGSDDDALLAVIGVMDADLEKAIRTLALPSAGQDRTGGRMMATKPTRKAPAKPAAPIDPIFSAIAEHKRQAKESTRLYGELGLPR